MARTRVEFTGHAGQLAGMLEYPETGTRAYALFAHCFSCGKDIAAASRISRALVARGIAVLRFDFTGLGNSDGDFANTNFSSNVADLVRAADFLRDNYHAPQLLIGHSLGGTAVLTAAHDIPEAKAVATIGAPATPDHVTRQFGEQAETINAKGKAEVDLGGRRFTITRQFMEDVAARSGDDVLGSLRRAVLILHSPTDNIVGIGEAETIYRGLRHPKSFVTLDAADHLLTDKADANYAADVIATWAARYVDWAPAETGVTNAAINAGEVVIEEHNHHFARRVRSDAHEWLADEPTRVGGHELGPDPYEHLLAALGTCTSMTIRMYANRKQLPLDDINIVLRHERTHREDCEACEKEERQLEVIQRDITLTGDLDEADRERLLAIADRCPVHRTLTGALRITSKLM